MKERKVSKQIPNRLELKAQVRAASYDPERRTFEVVFATPAPVRRFDWQDWEEFDEVLDINPSAIRMDRINTGQAPFLKDHFNSVDNTIGVIERAWIEGAEAKAVIRLSQREEVAGIAKDLADGILGNVSVGYKVYTYEKGKKGDDQPRATYVATDWEPMEISLVGVPADYNSKMRADSSDAYSVTVIETTTMEMEKEPKQPAPTAPNPEEMARAAVEAERLRIQTIGDLARYAELPEDFVRNLIDTGVDIEGAQRKIREAWSKKGIEKPVTNTAPMTAVKNDNEADHRRSGIADGLSLASGYVRPDQLSKDELERARHFQNEYGTSILGIARKALVDAGMKPSEIMGMSSMELIGRAITSSASDFPIYLEGTNRRTLISAYETQDTVWRKVCATGTVNDFRQYQRVEVAGMGTLPKKRENEEYKTLSMQDGERYYYSAETYGGILNLSREILINDDLGAVLRSANQLGMTAAMTIEQQFFKILAENTWSGPNISVGGISDPVFHANRNNVVNGAITATLFEAIVNAMNSHILPGSDTPAPGTNDSNPQYLRIDPMILMLDRSNFFTGRKVNENQYEQGVTDSYMPVSVAYQTFREVLMGNQIPASAKVAYAFADPMKHPVFQASFLNGMQTPMMETQRAWTTDGTEWKIRLDFGINAIGYRGGVKIILP